MGVVVWSCAVSASTSDECVGAERRAVPAVPACGSMPKHRRPSGLGRTQCAWASRRAEAQTKRGLQDRPDCARSATRRWARPHQCSMPRRRAPAGWSALRRACLHQLGAELHHHDAVGGGPITKSMSCSTSSRPHALALSWRSTRPRLCFSWWRRPAAALSSSSTRSAHRARAISISRA